MNVAISGLDGVIGWAVQFSAYFLIAAASVALIAYVVVSLRSS
jgi:hypothetical protein